MRTVYAFMAVVSLCSSPFVRARQTEEETTSVRQLVLEGVIVSSDPSRSVALVRRPGGSHARAVNVGETIYGFELLEVSDSAITVREGKEILRLTLSGEWEVTPAPALARASSSQSPSPSSHQRVRRELQRSLVEERLSEEMPRILTHTGVTPRVVEGEVRGFRITRLPGGTVLDDAGIRTGDVLLSINEISMNSAYALIDLYPRLQQEDEIRVVLERAGEVVTLVYAFN